MPATLMALRDAGWRVVNLACGLGRPAQHQRRRAEVEEACRRAGFELLPCEPPLHALRRRRSRRGRGDARHAARRRAAGARCGTSCARPRHTTDTTRTSSSGVPPGAPSPRTRARRRRSGCGASGPTCRSRRCSRPSTAGRLGEVKHALAAHASEQARLPLDRLIEARAVAQRGRRRGAPVRVGPLWRPRRSSTPSCSARSCCSRPDGSSDRRGASMPRRHWPRPRRARSAGGSRPSRCTTACGGRSRGQRT